MVRRPPGSKLTDPLFPYPTLFRAPQSRRCASWLRLHRRHTAAGDRQMCGQPLGWLRIFRQRLRRQPVRHGIQIRRRQALDDLAHAVRRLRMTAAGTPRTELPDQVIVRKPEQARRRRLHAGQLLAMTGATRRHVERGIAVIHQRATALKNVRSEEHTSELQSLMRISYAVFCLKKKKQKYQTNPVLTNETNKQLIIK